MSTVPVTGFPFLVKQFPLIFTFTPFAEVKVTAPAPAVIVKFCVFLLTPFSLILLNAAEVGGEIIMSSPSLLVSQLTNVITNKNKRLIVLNFVFMISGFYKSVLIRFKWFSDSGC
ncbi:hypothetical protein D3C87_1810540 [compost metagenome]